MSDCDGCSQRPCVCETVVLPTAEKDARPAYMDVVTILVRNPRDMIHRRTCRYAGRAKSLPWIWAEGKTRAEVSEARANGLHFCAACNPLGAIPTSVTSPDETRAESDPSATNGRVSTVQGADGDSA